MFLSVSFGIITLPFASVSIECKTVFAGLVEDLESDKNGRYSTAVLCFDSQSSKFHMHLCFSYAIVLLFCHRMQAGA